MNNNIFSVSIFVLLMMSSLYKMLLSRSIASEYCIELLKDKNVRRGKNYGRGKK
jgi:hypothetical protein